MGMTTETCDICGKPCVSGKRQGVFVTRYSLWVHDGWCRSVLDALLKDRSKSKRGRYRSTAEVRRLVGIVRSEAPR